MFSSTDDATVCQIARHRSCLWKAHSSTTMAARVTSTAYP
jgi:hypothetical protein